MINDYDIIFLQLGLNIDDKVLERAENLKIIVTATTGLDHIDIELAESKNIHIISLRGESEFLSTITGTAELAFGLIIELYRHISHSFDSVKKNTWDSIQFRGNNLYKKKIGIVGYGRLGKLMSRYAQGFFMQVLVCDPNLVKSDLENKEISLVSFHDLLQHSDVISIHVHLTSDTENMFAKKELSKMKNSAYLINTSRGRIVNHKDLLDALNNREIAGYGADVLDDELTFDGTVINNHPLVDYAKKNSNIVLTPHL